MTLLENMLVAPQGQAGERLLPNWISGGRIAMEERRNAQRAMALLDFNFQGLNLVGITFGAFPGGGPWCI